MSFFVIITPPSWSTKLVLTYILEFTCRKVWIMFSQLLMGHILLGDQIKYIIPGSYHGFCSFYHKMCEHERAICIIQLLIWSNPTPNNQEYVIIFPNYDGQYLVTQKSYNKNLHLSTIAIFLKKLLQPIFRRNWKTLGVTWE